MTKFDAIDHLESLAAAVETADMASVDSLAARAAVDVRGVVLPSDDLALAARQAGARIGYLERAIRAHGAAPTTPDTEKLRRRASRAVLALRDVVSASDSAPPRLDGPALTGFITVTTSVIAPDARGDVARHEVP